MCAAILRVEEFLMKCPDQPKPKQNTTTHHPPPTTHHRHHQPVSLIGAMIRCQDSCVVAIMSCGRTGCAVQCAVCSVQCAAADVARAAALDQGRVRVDPSLLQTGEYRQHRRHARRCRRGNGETNLCALAEFIMNRLNVVIQLSC